MKIITIIGARPQFIKAAMVSRAILNKASSGTDIKEYILHTGQHYDYNMSEIFFKELNVPAPTWHLENCGGVENMTTQIKERLQTIKADYVLTYGDTNSTLAGAIAAEELHIPLIHIEAGLRSHNMQMAEEYNRIQTDKRSQLLFCPTHLAIDNLAKEGITTGVYHCGDVMYDAALTFAPIAEKQSKIIEALGLKDKQFILTTIHRGETLNEPNKLYNIILALAQIDHLIVFPIHPHTKKVIESYPNISQLLYDAHNVIITESVSYLDMIMLERKARFILTDSGGVQKEAYFHKTPCITLRSETEWIETIDAGWNILVGTDTNNIIDALNHHFTKQHIDEYGQGNAADIIVDTICSHEY